MIGRLQGFIIEKQAPELLIDVHGVGYEVQAPLSTFAVLGKLGDPVTLYTHLAIREDAHQLSIHRFLKSFPSKFTIL